MLFRSNDSSPVSIEMMAVTCSTECLTQEVEQLMPESSISTNTPTSEVLSSAPVTSDIIPSVATAANPVSTKCLAETHVYANDSVQLLIAAIDSADETHATATTESFEHQPWPPPVEVQTSHMGQLFRPSPWPSFRPLSVTSYPEETCSSIHSQSHRGSCFSPWLVWLMFRDVHLEKHGNGTDTIMPCTSGIQHNVPERLSEIARRCSVDVQICSPGDGLAIARESDVPMKIRKMDKGSVGSSVAVDVISLTRCATCKYQFSRDSSMTDFPAGSEVENEDEYYEWNTTPGLVGCEASLNLQSIDECSADTDSETDKHLTVASFLVI